MSVCVGVTECVCGGVVEMCSVVYQIDIVQSVIVFISQCVGQSVQQKVSQLVSQSVNWSVNQSIGRSISQLVGQPAGVIAISDC